MEMHSRQRSDAALKRREGRALLSDPAGVLAVVGDTGAGFLCPCWVYPISRPSCWEGPWNCPRQKQFLEKETHGAKWPNLPAVPGEVHRRGTPVIFLSFFFWSNPHPLILIEKYLKLVPEKNSNELCNGHMLSHQILMFTLSDATQKTEAWDCAGNDPSYAAGF